jgi:hypothetical protein
MRGMIDLERFDDEGDTKDTVTVHYNFTPADPGCLWGDYPEPPAPASVEIWVTDKDVVLSQDERDRAEEAAMEDASGYLDYRGRPLRYDPHAY